MGAYKPFNPSTALFGALQGGPIVLREEQQEAVKLAKKQFGKTTDGVYTVAPNFRKFLWNAKMRFGKTLCAMELVKQMGVQRVLIVTHRPVVNKEWSDNFKKVFTKASGLSGKYDYGTRSANDHNNDHNDYYELEKDAKDDKRNHYVFFASMQYLRRSSMVTGREDEDENQLKKDILLTDWDLVIIDEAHEGTRTALGQRVIELLKKQRTKMLHLSGTPFNLYEDFSQNEIYTWDYIQEQQAKNTWAEKHPDEDNPYAVLPQMKILIFDLSQLISNFVAKGGEFKFSEFFRTWTGNPKADGKAMPEGMKGRFIHEEEVKQFLDKLCEESETSNYPFSKDNYLDTFNHTLWIVPGVKEAKALANLLSEHDTFSAFTIINVAGKGDEDEQREDALDRVKDAIKVDHEQGYTITISCGKLTTGVTIPQWTAVFYMKGSEMTSASTYMQTIFRVQSPWTRADGSIKQECYVFDFAPNRTLKMVAETAKFSSHAKKNQKKKNADGEDMTQDERDKETMRQFLELCPVLSLDGGQMKPYDADRLFGKLNSVYIDRLVLSGFDDNCLYNQDELMAMDADALKALGKKIGEVANMKKPPKLMKNSALLINQLTEEQLRLIAEAKRKARENRKKGKKPDEDLTPEELAAREAWREARKQAREERDRRIANIKGISLRIPLLMYGGADVNNGKDADEPLTTENFTRKIKDESWREFMPKGVTKQDFNAIRRVFNATRFEKAGERYRDLAREADEMHVEDRIKRIADIFDCFRNPDKETVLTPWRVVNMHMSDTLGGYCFFNERFDGPNEKWLENPGNGQLFESVETNEPRPVNRGEVTQEVFGNSQSKILEINSKTGLYPLYVTYSLYRHRMQDFIDNDLIIDIENYSVEEEQVVWDDILKNNIFVICNTPMAKLITKRTLCGFREVDAVNIKNDKLIERATTDKTDRDALVADIKRAGYWRGNTSKEEMKFNVVVGNPPYQMENGEGNRKEPIYHFFYDMAFTLSDKVSLITPGRFLFNTGQTPSEWNRKMLNDKHFKVVKYIQNSSDVFPSVEIKGGIAITYRDIKKDFGIIGVYAAFNELNDIASKVKADKSFKSFSDIIFTPYSYKFTPTMYAENKGIEDSMGNYDSLRSNIFDRVPQLFHNHKPNDGCDYVQILGLEKSKRTYKWIKRVYVNAHKNLDKWKVFITESNGSGAIGEILSTPIIGHPIVGHTQTFISIGALDTEFEATAVYKYIATKFTRTLLGVLKATQHNNKDAWQMVPMQDFTPSSDIDWTASVADIDKQLYKKYNLSEDEISFIEKMIKPME